ncbi:MAG: hypothetical protein AAGG09_17870, partial [Pseudomonadota bacterium]
MNFARLAGAATGATLCLLPFSALALTPQEAWDRWKEQAEATGMSIAVGAEDASGDGLTVSNVAFSQDLDGATLAGTIAELRFADAGGGTVTVSVSEQIPMTLNGVDEDGVAYDAAMTLRAPGFTYTVTDGPSDGTDASYDVPEMTLVLDSISEDGEPLDFTLTASLTEISGTYVASGDDLPEVESATSAAQLSFDISGSDPDEGTFDFTMTMADIASASTAVGMSMFNMMDDPETLIESGMSAQTQGSAGTIEMNVSVQDSPETFDLQVTMGGGEGSASVGADRIEYDVAYNDLAFTASGSEIPFPQVTGMLGQSQTQISIPTGSTDEVEPLAFLMALRDLSLGEEIWSMFDPSGALPRDPATLVIDLAGQARVLTNLFSTDFEESDEMPAEFEQVDINELRLSVAGAELTGEGSV